MEQEGERWRLSCGSYNCWTHEVWNRHTDHAQGHYVECYDCGAAKGVLIYHNGTWDGFYKTEAEAIEAWNTRAERTCEFMPYSEKSDDGICSKCVAYMYEQDNYCPNCGTRIKEDADE